MVTDRVAPMPIERGGRHVRDRIEAGEFQPVIDRTYALDDIVEAYKYVDTEQKVGNVVITTA